MDRLVEAMLQSGLSDDMIDSGVLAGMSATMAYWLVACMLGMGILSWRYRERYANWLNLSQGDRADAILSISLFGFFAHAAFHRAYASYGHATREWPLSALTLAITPVNLLWALVSVSGLLWWTCYAVFGAGGHQRWWWMFVATGAWLGAGISWRY